MLSERESTVKFIDSPRDAELRALNLACSSQFMDSLSAVGRFRRSMLWDARCRYASARAAGATVPQALDAVARTYGTRFPVDGAL